MNPLIEQALTAMITYETGCPQRIQHLIKVYTFSKLIALGEGLDPDTLFTLEAAAAVHDIGIRKAEEVHGRSNGKLQEELGPAEAEALLTRLGFPKAVTERVCWLVGHHHTYTDIQGLDYQILVEADFLVNFLEGGVSTDGIAATARKIFRTASGKQLCSLLYGVDLT